MTVFVYLYVPSSNNCFLTKTIQLNEKIQFLTFDHFLSGLIAATGGGKTVAIDVEGCTGKQTKVHNGKHIGVEDPKSREQSVGGKACEAEDWTLPLHP